MKVINSDSRFKIYQDNVVTYDQLPSCTFTLKFELGYGFYLEKLNDINVEEKIYGNHEEKAIKILNSFNKFSRNLGVILSGDKGIGKSICAKLIAKKAVEKGYPVILITNAYENLADYLISINQECVIIFDEFEKIFLDDADQKNLLTLFDGLVHSKKMFVITCNNPSDLNRYLINRPGRFHYHLRFNYPDAAEIKDYLMDNLNNKFYKEIDSVIEFSTKVNINYDCLRAIAFELNQGIDFNVAIKDLNITRLDFVRCAISVIFNDNSESAPEYFSLDFYDSDHIFELYTSYKNESLSIKFNPKDSVYNKDGNYHLIPVEKLVIDNDCLNSTHIKHIGDNYSDTNIVKYLKIKKLNFDNIHY